MKKINRILWGIALIAVGGLLILKGLDIIDINLFFDGWWTLFIIVPCFIGLFSETDKTGNIIGICIGIALLLGCQEIIRFDILWKLFLPVIIVVFGVSLIFKGVSGDKSNKIMKRIKENGEEIKESCAVFSGQNLNFNNEVFKGAELTAVFGGIKCDLSKAIIESDVVINASGIFGGVDIILPNTVNVKVNSTAIFGGTGNKKGESSSDNAYTVYINSTCIFGGVDIK